MSTQNRQPTKIYNQTTLPNVDSNYKKKYKLNKAQKETDALFAITSKKKKRRKKKKAKRLLQTSVYHTTAATIHTNDTIEKKQAKHSAKLTKSRSQKLVFAYVDKMQRLLAKNKIISTDLFELCLLYYFNEEFIYCHDFDTNGIIYALATNYGETEWKNPAETGIIKLGKLSYDQWAFYASWYRNMNNVVGRTPLCCGFSDYDEHYFGNSDKSVTFDFGKLKIIPTAYTIRHGWDSSALSLRNWTFEGSKDGIAWDFLTFHTNDTSLNNSFASYTWTIDSNEAYRVFKIQMTGVNSSGTHSLQICGFEIYGHLIDKTVETHTNEYNESINMGKSWANMAKYAVNT